MTTIRETTWIWGHDAGAHHTGKARAWGVPGENRMGPWEGACALGGIPNCCRVVFAGKPAPPFDRASEDLKPFDKVVWSLVGDASSLRNNSGGDDLEEVLRQAERFPNVVGGIVDDFFRLEQGDARMSPEAFAEVARRLHEAPRPLELWLVYYSNLFEVDYSAWLKSVDVITFWTWKAEQLPQAEANIRRMAELAPGKRILAGCYLYDYGTCRPMPADKMQFQLDMVCRLLKEGLLQGMVVCSNTLADCGLDAAEIFRKWLEEHGDDVIGCP